MDVLPDDLVDVFLVDVGIPDFLGINDHHRTFVTAVQTSRHIDTHFARTIEREFLDFGFGVIAYFGGAMVVAAAFAVLALIAAEENVMAIVTHDVWPVRFRAAVQVAGIIDHG